MSGPGSRALHHVELWTADLGACRPGWHWLFSGLGWTEASTWPGGVSWAHADGTYVVLEQSPDVRGKTHDRLRPGLNHLALTCPDRGLLDRLREEASAYGWSELFADRYPHAGGPGHVALFLEDAHGFEVELVVG